MMEIVNKHGEDYHVHSINFSDGFNTIDELAIYAGKIGLKKLIITDHSDALLEALGYCKKGERSIVLNWENVHNDVKVSFGVEGDLLDESGKFCDNIQGYPTDFLILSAHPTPYSGDPKDITKAYIEALKRGYKLIDVIGHPCANYFGDHVNIEDLTKAANDYGVALEINGTNLKNNKTNIPKLLKMLELADRIYVNSDAHTLNQLRDSRKAAFEFLREHGF